MWFSTGLDPGFISCAFKSTDWIQALLTINGPTVKYTKLQLKNLVQNRIRKLCNKFTNSFGSKSSLFLEMLPNDLWWHRPPVLPLGGLKLENYKEFKAILGCIYSEFKTSLDYIERHCQNKAKQNKQKK